MKTHKELFIRSPVANTEQISRAIDAALTGGWTRAHDAERTGTGLSTENEFLYYCCDRRSNREPGMVAIYRRDPQTLYVSNVVPTEGFELNFAQYNAILADFHDSVLLGVKNTPKIEFALTSDTAKVEDMMSQKAFRLLKEFSSSANKSTGSCHPSDQQRWFAFLVTLQTENHRFDEHWLRRWLVEVEKWPEEMAYRLQSEFTFAVGLLNFVHLHEAQPSK